MSDLPFQDPSHPFDVRVNDLVSRLTIGEKISQMVNWSAEIPRLGVPAYDWWGECLHGVARAGVATVFPQAIGLAATWNTDLMYRVADAISDEARAKHHEFVRQGVRSIYTGLTFWSPNINIFRDPRWGRGQETYGEDPYLTSRLGVAFVKGLQGGNPRYLKVVATPKHFAVHSGPEPARHSHNAVVGDRDLRETYLPAFEAAVKEGGAYSVMGAYNRTNGEPCCASPTLLQKILREEWGFDGYVVSDCWAVRDIFGGHMVVETPEEASALAVSAGCDLECGCDYPKLLEAFKLGLISEAEIDRAVKRLFTARFKLGMFDPTDRVPYAQIPFEVNDSPAHRALSLKAAQESIVLLKNDGILPLSRDIKRIAVIGPNADSIPTLLGNYHGTPSYAVTPLEGIRAKVAPNTEVIYARGCDLAQGVPVFSVIPKVYLQTFDGKSGLTGVYWKNIRQEGEPEFVRTDVQIDFAWGVKNPFGGFPSDKFSVRWVGNIIAQSSGTFQIAVNGDSGYRLFFNGQEVLPHKENGHCAWRRSVSVTLKAGCLYPIQLDYFNSGRDPQVQLLWAVPGENPSFAAMIAADRSDVVVFVAGISAVLEGEEMPVNVPGFKGGDRTSIDLPETQEKLLKQLNALGKPIVLVLLNGSALAVNWAAENLPAIVEAWYPGEEGGTAIADVLFGDYNPAGRLPVTFYKGVEQLPPFEDYHMAGRTYRFFESEPLYPFGYGLSYTRFEYRNLRIGPQRVNKKQDVNVFFEVANVGELAGDEVVQLYLRYPDSKVARPIMELKGFKRITLEAGETQFVAIPLNSSQTAFYNQDRWWVESGTVEVLIGASSSDIRLIGQFCIK